VVVIVHRQYIYSLRVLLTDNFQPAFSAGNRELESRDTYALKPYFLGKVGL